MQYCRLPTNLNGWIDQVELCPNTMRTQKIYINAGTNAETVIGVMYQYRSKWGYLISTIRLDCPYMIFFSTRPNARRSLLESGSTSRDLLVAPSLPAGLTSNGSVLMGQGHNQYKEGKPDMANFIDISYTLLNGTTVNLPTQYMMRYQVGRAHVNRSGVSV